MAKLRPILLLILGAQLSPFCFAENTIDPLLAHQSKITRTVLKNSMFSRDKKLTEALNESATAPNFCETALKHGTNDETPVKNLWDEFYNFHGNDDILKSLEKVPKEITDQANQRTPAAPDQRKYLTEFEAKQLLEQSKAACAIEMKDLGGGICFLRSSTVAMSLAEDFPSVPLLKIWMVGPMEFGNESWKYHTVPVIPVLNSKTGKVEWQVFDTLLSPQLASASSWANTYVQRGTRCGRTELFLSDSSRKGPYANDGFEKAPEPDIRAVENAAGLVIVQPDPRHGN